MPVAKQYKRSPSTEAGMSSTNYQPVTANDSGITIGNDEPVVIEIPDEVDIDNRDPKRINHHLKVAFYEIFAEPDPTIHSFNKVWFLSFAVFKQTKLWCYRILTLICGLPCAFCWGISFACLSFCNIWLWVPTIRSWVTYLDCMKKVVHPFMDCFLAPCWAAIGKIFSGINVRTIKQ